MRIPSAVREGGLLAGLAVAVSAALALACGWNRIVSGSVDITYHLQVLDVVRANGLVPASAEAFMAEMYGYPDAGHRIAAALTHLGIGDLNALILVGCFSAALAWFCLLDQARRAGLWVLAGAILLTLLNAWVTRASFGAEIVSNFFFSQMAGEAFAVLALALGQPILKRSRPAYVAYAVAATLLAGCFHLIPALHLALGAGALLGVALLRRLLAERRVDLVSLGGAGLVVAAIVANPYFLSMRRVSSNDGTVGYAVDFSFTQLAVLELGLLVLSALVLVALALKREDEVTGADRASGLLAALGAAAAAAGLAQIVSFLVLGESSTYAVKKHAFGILTMLCFVVPVWAARVGRSTRPAPAWSLAVVVAAQAAVMAVLFARPPILDVRAVDRLLADARGLRLARGLDRTDILFAASRVRPLVSYAVSSAALRRRRDDASIEVLYGGYPLHMERVARLATLEGDLFDKPECRDGPPLHGLVVVRGACAALPAIRFGAGGDGGPYLKEGWSGPEAGGVWSIGPRAAAEIPVSPEARRFDRPRLEVAVFGYLPPKSPSRTVRVAAGGTSQAFTFTGKARAHAFSFPLPRSALAEGKVRLVFEIADPVSPKAAGEGDDPRPLGVGLEQVRFLPTVAD